MGGGRRLSGIFHGVAGVVIGFPLLWEASTRFSFLPPPASAGALAVLTGLALIVAQRRRLHVVAGLAMLGALVTSLALGAHHRPVRPFILLLNRARCSAAVARFRRRVGLAGLGARPGSRRAGRGLWQFES